MNWTYLIFGKLTLHAFPFYSIIATFAASLVVLGVITVSSLLFWFKLWKPFWFEWLTSLDHKKIGVMYVVISLVMLSRAIIEASLMRLQQAMAYNNPGFLPADHFAQLFTTHGTIMVFFMGMPFLIGLMNIAMPLQIGARDVAFPLMNAISLALTASGSALLMVSLVLGKFSTGGWSGYPPYTELGFQPDVGPDYWIWALTLSGVGITLTGINFAVTIYKKRCPGMHLFRMPLFCWTTLCTSILVIFAVPPLTVATTLLAMDRYLGMHFFTNADGGNMMNYVNLFWLFGHPEVYVLILPAFGVYNEVIPVFSTKRIYGYKALVAATMAIAVLSFTVWLHHFFTMGQSSNVNAAFGVATMLIAIPTGVKIYDWMLTMFRGRVRFQTPMLYAIAFIVLFAIGGSTGVMLANPGLDYQVHNTVFLVAHFHNVLIPGLLFGMLAGYTYWFPKMFGFRLSEFWGRISCGLWVFGFMFAFFPLYVLGVLGMPRRDYEYFEPGYRIWTYLALFGVMLVLGALATLALQLLVSIRDREQNRVPVGDPWNGRTLEWGVSAPPPEWNFAVIPTVDDIDPFNAAKDNGTAYRLAKRYEPIEMPRNSAVAPVIGIGGALCGFGLTWHIWWMAVFGLLVMMGAVIARSFVTNTKRTISAAEVREHEEYWLAEVRRHVPIDRDHENEPVNQGLAEVGVA